MSRKSIKELSDESGQTVIFAALCMVVLIGFLGIAVDVAHLRYTKRHMQSLADATALAAAREIRVCGIHYTANSSCSYMVAAAKSAVTMNDPGVTPNFITDCAMMPTSGLTLELNGTPCALGPADPNHGKTGYVETVVSTYDQTYFAKLLGFNNVLVSARAEASRNPSPPCIYALDPSSSGAITFAVGLLFRANCAVIDESYSDTALFGLVCALTTAPKISVAGGDFALLALGCPNVQTNVPPPTPADPLAYLPAPANALASCGGPPQNSGLLLPKTVYTGSPSPVNIGLLTGLAHQYTFNPGVYCGGINIALSILGSFTFNPGVYILRPQGISGGLSITANVLTGFSMGSGDPGGIMFYNEGPTISAALGGFNIDAPTVLGQLDLRPPTSGEYAGVLFFQPKGNAAQDNILANLLFNGLSTSNFGGAIYAPDALLNYTACGVSTNNNIIVAKDINILVGALCSTGQVNMSNNSSSSSLGSPLVGDDAVLIQ